MLFLCSYKQSMQKMATIFSSSKCLWRSPASLFSCKNKLASLIQTYKTNVWVSRLPVRLHQSTQSTPCQVFYTGICHVSSASLPQPGQSLMLCRMLPSWFLWKSLLWNVCPRKLWLCVYQYPFPRGEGRQDVNCDVMSVNSVRTTGSFSFLLS